MRKTPATAKANAIDLFGRSTNTIKADAREVGIKMRIGTARLRIAVCPISRNVCGRNATMLRLNANQVPQKTPITKENKTIVENCTSFMGSFSFIQLEGASLSPLICPFREEPL